MSPGGHNRIGINQNHALRYTQCLQRGVLVGAGCRQIAPYDLVAALQAYICMSWS